MKQKVFSWRDRFSVKDENGSDRFFAQGELFTWGKKLHVHEPDGKEAAFIRQIVLSWLPRYAVEIDGKEVCRVVKEFSFMKPRYHLEGLPWRLEGDFFAHEYSLYHQDELIMRLSKKWFTWGDSYELDIFRPEDERLCLCVALAVDCAVERQTGSRHGTRHRGMFG
jgi:uncharacterized protein YxjI